MTQRRKSRSVNRRVEEYGQEMIIIFAIHYTGVKLSELDEGIEPANFLSRPDRVNTVREKDWPESGGLPNGKENNSVDVGVDRIFFQAEISLPIGGQMKRHSPDQLTEKASVQREPVKAYREKKRGHRALVGEAKGSKVKPPGRKRDWSTEKEASSMPQSSLSKEREPTSAA